VSPYGFFRALRFLIYFAVTWVGVLFLLGYEIYIRVMNEWSCRARHGAEWRQYYDQEQHVSLAETNTQILVAVGGIVAVTVLTYLIYRQAVPNKSRRPGSRRRKKRSVSLPN
jgi:Ca2+/Na+ antiporter